MYTSETEAVAAIKALISDGLGWTVLPNDIPMRGLGGYSVFRTPEPTEANPEPEEILSRFMWPLFGKELTPQIVQVTAGEWLDFASTEAHERLFSCDAPLERLLGVVSYHPKYGEARIRYCPLNSAIRREGIGDVYRAAAFMKMKSALRTKSEVMWAERRVTAAALSSKS